MIKRLSKCIREYKKASLLTPFFVSLEVVMEVIIPYYMGKMLDYGVNMGNMNYIIKVGAMLAIFCVMSLLFGALAGKYAAYASAGFSKNLRHDMFYNVQSFSFSNIAPFQAL